MPGASVFARRGLRPGAVGVGVELSPGGVVLRGACAVVIGLPGTGTGGYCEEEETKEGARG